MDIERLKALIAVKYADKFTLFSNLLKERNKMYNLTSVTDDEGIFYRHFLDSVSGEEFFFEGARVAEIGSGGGFPSVPLKIIRDDLKFTLFESTKKKCSFLEDVVKELNLGGMEIVNMRAEDGARLEIYREKFDICCARAVAKLNTLAEYCLPYIKIGGRFIAYKGDCGNEINEALRAINILGGEVEKAESFELEGCGRRTLVVVRKVDPTNAKYPRGNGKERKNPL